MSHPQTQAPLLVNTRDAAKLLCISERKLHTLKQTGVIPHITMGVKVLYSVESLKAWIAQNEKGGGSHE